MKRKRIAILLVVLTTACAVLGVRAWSKSRDPDHWSHEKAVAFLQGISHDLADRPVPTTEGDRTAETVLALVGRADLFSLPDVVLELMWKAKAISPTTIERYARTAVSALVRVERLPDGGCELFVLFECRAADRYPSTRLQVMDAELLSVEIDGHQATVSELPTVTGDKGRVFSVKDSMSHPQSTVRLTWSATIADAESGHILAATERESTVLTLPEGRPYRIYEIQATEQGR